MNRYKSPISIFAFLIILFTFGNLQTAYSGGHEDCDNDHTCPSLQCNAVNVWLDANGYASIDEYDVVAHLDDNCCDDEDITVTVSQTEFSCEDLDKGPNHSPTLGQVQVIVYATDCHDNTASCTTWVNVHYRPEVHAECVEELTVQLGEECSPVTITPEMLNNGSSAVDPCGDGELTYTVEPETLSEPGTYTVTLTVTDKYGNSDYCTTTVTVDECEQGEQGEVVIVCQEYTVYLDENGQATIDPEDVLGEGSSGYTGLTVEPNTFDCSNLGANEVVLTGTDDEGNTASCTTTVYVEDNSGPTITCPGDITVGTGPDATTCDAVVTWDVLVNDNCSENLDVVSDYESGSTFPVGTTTVTITATDESGNSAQCSFNVTVNDDTPPVLSGCPEDITAYTGEDDDDCTAEDVTWTPPTATDNCDQDVDVTSDYDPGCAFPVGTTTVTYTATDDYGNTSTCSFDVTVIDNTEPEVTVRLSPSVLWPPNHKLRDITATVSANDNCCDDEDLTTVLYSITSNEPDNGLGDGDTQNDIQYASTGTADYTFKLRSERSGTGSGRVYTVTYKVTDCNGNETYASGTVTVPHNQPKEPDLSFDPNQSGAFGIDNISPNPFNNSTLITFMVPETDNVSLAIYNSTGSLVRELVHNNLPAGTHSLIWDGSDASGRAVSSGVYYATLKAGVFTTTMVITVVK